MEAIQTVTVEIVILSDEIVFNVSLLVIVQISILADETGLNMVGFQFLELRELFDDRLVHWQYYCGFLTLFAQGLR